MNYFVKIVFISVVLIQTRISAQWNLVENLPVSEYSTVYEFNDTLYAGTGNRLYISADSGYTWNPSAVIKEEVDFISTILKVDNTIFVGTYAHGVFKSTNNGVSWTTFNNGLTGIIDIEELVQRGDSIYAGTIGSSIYAARIDGNAWSPFNNNIPMNIAGNVFALYNFNGRLITGSGANANIYYNDAGSTNWTEVPFTKFSSLGTSMNSIISKGSILYGTGSQGIYSSTDGGLTWLQFDPGFSFVENGSLQIYYNTVIAMIARISGTYYYSSSNNLTQWNLFEYQPGVFTYNFAILNNKIFASRFDGLYYTDIPISDVVDEEKHPKDFVLEQNFPNPFNPKTKIKYSIPTYPSTAPPLVKGGNEAGFVVLKVYDVLGNEVATLVNEEQKAGNYEVYFDASNISSGVYFYKLQAGEFIQTKKMILLR